MYKEKKAVTLTELIIAVMLVGIIALISLPRLNFAVISRQKADTIAGRIVTDLRRTRRLAISDAANNNNGYALNMVGASPYSSYEIVNLDTSATVDTLSVDSQVSCTGGAAFKFGPLGNLLPASGTQLTLSAQGKSFTITIISATGAVKCTEN